MAIVVAGVAIGGGLYLAEDQGPPSSSGDVESASSLVLKGVVVMDGTTNGCAGENLLVEVRDGTGNAASESVPSDFAGLDCAFPFAIPVPELDCYRLVISETPVGEYPKSALEQGSSGGVLDVGYIDRESVFGDPESGSDAVPFADWPYGCR